MSIELLEWDTRFLNFKVGKLLLTDADNFDVSNFKQQAKEEEYKLIYVSKFQTMLSPDIVIAANLELMDIQVTMSKQFMPNDYKSQPYNFRTELDSAELDGCYYIAEETSSVSRLYREKLIGPKMSKLMYRKWIDNTLNKSFSDGLFLSSQSNKISGLHVIRTDKKNKVGYFTLTGVHPSFKRQGIGNTLWNESYAYWANESQIDKIKSPFSLQNAASFNLHLKMGFDRIDEIKYLYHYRG